MQLPQSAILAFLHNLSPAVIHFLPFKASASQTHTALACQIAIYHYAVVLAYVSITEKRGGCFKQRVAGHGKPPDLCMVVMIDSSDAINSAEISPASQQSSRAEVGELFDQVTAA